MLTKVCVKNGLSHVGRKEGFHEDDSVQYQEMVCGIVQKLGLATALLLVRLEALTSEILNRTSIDL